MAFLVVYNSEALVRWLELRLLVKNSVVSCARVLGNKSRTHNSHGYGGHAQESASRDILKAHSSRLLLQLDGHFCVECEPIHLHPKPYYLIVFQPAAFFPSSSACSLAICLSSSSGVLVRNCSACIPPARSISSFSSAYTILCLAGCIFDLNASDVISTRKCVSLDTLPCMAWWCACMLESLWISSVDGCRAAVICTYSGQR